MADLGDQILWYLPDEYYEKPLCFFSKVIGSNGNSGWETMYEFNQHSELHQEYAMFNVEVLGIDRLVLSIRMLTSRFAPDNICLVTEVDGEEYAACKILCPDYAFEPSVNRVWNIPIPHIERNGRYIYPKFYTNYGRATSNPIGGELVALGEHHHALVYSDGTKDSFPSLGNSVTNRIRAAWDYGAEMDGIDEATSYAHQERGILASTHVDMTGQETTGTGFLDGLRDRERTIDFTDVLANVLEMIIMANNRIQLLGQTLSTKTENIPASEYDEYYFLISDRTEASDDRKLYAIPWENLRNWIVERLSTSGSAVEVKSSVAVVTASANFTLNFSSKYSIALVRNTRTSSGINNTTYSSNTISVTYQYASNATSTLSIPPGYFGLFYSGSDSGSSSSRVSEAWLIGQGEKDRVDTLMDGTSWFTKISLGDSSTTANSGAMQFTKSTTYSTSVVLITNGSSSTSAAGVTTRTGFYTTGS